MQDSEGGQHGWSRVPDGKTVDEESQGMGREQNHAMPSRHLVGQWLYCRRNGKPLEAQSPVIM